MTGYLLAAIAVLAGLVGLFAWLWRRARAGERAQRDLAIKWAGDYLATQTAAAEAVERVRKAAQDAADAHERADHEQAARWEREKARLQEAVKELMHELESLKVPGAARARLRARFGRVLQDDPVPPDPDA